mmetsp:Transcript_29009/g.91603  ORF Transcript_29009/g.91603 Transcript_29009/m.91603 type:complete len:246 (-) Transcript_29009:728-1465(-)
MAKDMCPPSDGGSFVPTSLGALARACASCLRRSFLAGLTFPTFLFEGFSSRLGRLPVPPRLPVGARQSLLCTSLVRPWLAALRRALADRVGTMVAWRTMHGALPLSSQISLKDLLLLAQSISLGVTLKTASSESSGVLSVLGSSRRIKCRLISSCMCRPSMAFSSVPNGFSISSARKFRDQRTNTCIKTKMKAQKGWVTHCETTMGTRHQCRISSNSQVWAYGKGKGVSEILTHSWKATIPRANS